MKREISSTEIDSANKSKRPKLADPINAPATPKAETANASTPSKSSRRVDRNKNEGQQIIRRKTSKSRPSGRTKKCGGNIKRFNICIDDDLNSPFLCIGLELKAQGHLARKIFKLDSWSPGEGFFLLEPSTN